MLASTLILGLGSLAAGCASAEDAEPSPTLAVTERAEGVAAPAPAPPAPRRAIGSPRAACLHAARQAEAAHGIPQGLLVAVALAESGLHAYAMNIGGHSHFPSSNEDARRLYKAAGRGQAVMAGCVQVNARVHARGSEWPLDPWAAADWGAGFLRAHYERSGSWMEALRRWNGGGASGSRLACRVQAKLAAANPRSTLLSDARCGGNARERRNGEALLEIAEAAE